jgi:pimeloyl-ACP methyl ester carboxylesterase
VGSTGFPRDEQYIRERAARSYDRGFDVRAGGRQLGAILLSGDRTETIRRINLPTLVIHGTVDKMIRPSGGRATAKAIPGARLMMIEGMGHDLPRGAWPQLLNAISEHARAADGVRARAAA